MANGRPATPKEMVWIGAAFAAVGLYIMLVGIGILPVPGGPGALHAPLWVVTCAGAPFFLAGLSVMLQGIGKANANGALPPDAPLWMRAAQRLIMTAIVACFAAIGSWVAVYGDARQFSGSFSGLGMGVTIARVAFGIGALTCWAATIALIVSSLRMLASPRKTS